MEFVQLLRFLVIFRKCIAFMEFEITDKFFTGVAVSRYSLLDCENGER